MACENGERRAKLMTDCGPEVDIIFQVQCQRPPCRSRAYCEMVGGCCVILPVGPVVDDWNAFKPGLLLRALEYAWLGLFHFICGADS